MHLFTFVCLQFIYGVDTMCDTQIVEHLTRMDIKRSSEVIIWHLTFEQLHKVKSMVIYVENITVTYVTMAVV